MRRFHPPPERIDGIIGGPPCKRFSRLANIVRAVHGEDSLAPDLIPEFSRCIAEARPPWFVMENVPDAPLPDVGGYVMESTLFNNRWLGAVQNRARRFTFGAYGDTRFRPDEMVRALHAQSVAMEAAEWEPAVTSTAGGRRVPLKIDGSGKMKGNQRRGPGGELKYLSVADMLRLQGLPEDTFDDCPLTVRGLQEAIGNGVPLPLGRAVAKAVGQAIGLNSEAA